jgi:hypothetical protein
MAYNSTYYEIEVKDAPNAYLKPQTDWDKLVLIVDRNLGNFINTLGNTVITGFSGSYLGQTVTFTAGKAFAAGVCIESSGTSNIVISTTNGTYKIYASVLDAKAGTFNLSATVGSVPASGVYLYDAVVTGSVITSIVDRRTTVPNIANHNHSGGVQGAQITNAGIDSAAAIAYSKLNLAASIVNADIATGAAITYAKLNLTGGIVNADVNASAAIVYSKLNLAGGILNADVNASAAIAYSKLNLAASIVNADVSASAAIAYSKLNLAGGIVNADINASAAIAYSKLNLVGSVTYTDMASSSAKCEVYDEGAILANNIKTLKFLGAGVTVTNPSTGVVEITIP